MSRTLHVRGWTSATRHLALGVRPRAVLLAAALVGCGGNPEQELDVTATSSALVITNCTGAAISAAVAAGGDVILSCGANPVIVAVPLTNVTRSGRLSATPGMVTLINPTRQFEVNNNATYEFDNIVFNATTTTSTVAHILPGTVTFSGCSFSGYQGFAVSVQGGSSLVVSGSTFSSNGSASSGFAAPIYSEGSGTTVLNSTFIGNRSGGSGGAIVAVGGGGLKVVGSTFANNKAAAGGAIYTSAGTNTIINSTFTTNHASNAGGAIFAANTLNTGAVNITNGTFANNDSPNGSFAGTAVLSNSILLDQVSPAAAGCLLGGSGNIEWPTTMTLCGPGFRYSNPVLGGLGNNGGPTMTMALGTGSGAIDSGIGGCPATDQRGVARPRDGDGNGSAICDVGAYER